MSKQCKSVDLGSLQSEAEGAAKVLKGARTTLANATQAVERAEAAYSVAQNSLKAGVEQVKASTKVG